MSKQTVDLYFDFISPYVWLGLHEAQRLASQHAISWRLRPIAYGVLLSTHGLVGPVETPAKRRYTFHDVARRAQQAGLRFCGPPAHPFRSLAALRAMTLHRDASRALELAVALADAAWRDGHDLTSVAVLAEVLAAQGFEAERLGERLQEPAVKERLKRETEAAITGGVFGVPTFGLAGELFWGQDRLEDLGRRLAGERFQFAAEVSAMLDRPVGVERRQR